VLQHHRDLALAVINRNKPAFEEEEEESEDEDSEDDKRNESRNALDGQTKEGVVRDCTINWQ
jgi:hypothetical protein